MLSNWLFVELSMPLIKQVHHHCKPSNQELMKRWSIADICAEKKNDGNNWEVIYYHYPWPWQDVDSEYTNILSDFWGHNAVEKKTTKVLLTDIAGFMCNSYSCTVTLNISDSSRHSGWHINKRIRKPKHLNLNQAYDVDNNLNQLAHISGGCV